MQAVCSTSAASVKGLSLPRRTAGEALRACRMPAMHEGVAGLSEATSGDARVAARAPERSGRRAGLTLA